MTKTCFRGGCSKAYAGASVAEYGTIGGASERSQVVLRTPKLDPGVGPAPSDLRLPGGRGRRKRRSPNTSAFGPAPSDLRLPGGRGRRKRRSPNTSASAGQRHIFSEITACSALVPGSAERTSSSRLALRSTPSARQIRDAPRASFDSAMVEPKHSGHTRACHKAVAQGLAKPGFARSACLFR